jgi:phosphoglycolate/pyridoxal phosphate phosphatase family enzyme
MRHPLFAKTKYFILDMDGTFYLGGKMIPGAGDFASSLASLGLDYRFFSNNSANSVALCRRRLAHMGFPAEEDRVLLSSHVAADYLCRNRPGEEVFLLGNENLRDVMLAFGVPLWEDFSSARKDSLKGEKHGRPDLILLGFDTTLNYEKIHKAANWLADGVPYFATHPDVNCPTADGFMPDTGAMIALFEASTGRRPIVLGKPEKITVDYIASRLCCQPQELAFVGDRLETDVAIGVRHGIPSVLVLSGVTNAEQHEASGFHADLVVPSLAELTNYLI